MNDRLTRFGPRIVYNTDNSTNSKKVLAMSGNVAAVSDEAFENDVLKSSTPVLVDFWAVWCNPCKALAPIVEELAPNYAGKIKFTKMDVEKNPNTPAKYNVRGIPTLLVFVDGQVKATHVGFLNKTDLIKFLDGVL